MCPEEGDDSLNNVLGPGPWPHTRACYFYFFGWALARQIIFNALDLAWLVSQATTNI
jgi:hypothetical protein